MHERVQMRAIFTFTFHEFAVADTTLGLFTRVFSPHHDVVVDEASAIACRFEMRILLSAGDPDVPNSPPGLVQLHVHRVDPRVVRGHGIAHVHGDIVLLEGERREGCIHK